MLKKSPIAKFVASVLFILGSYSAVVNAKVTHQGVVDGKVTLSSNQVAQSSIIDGAGKLTLTGNAKATNTHVNTDSTSAIFYLKDNSSASNSRVSYGLMMLSGHATALVTFIGLKKGEKPDSNKILGKMSIRQNGKTQNTIVATRGLLHIENNGMAENTTVLKGGKLVVKSGEPNVRLVETIIKGGELALENEVTLEGETKFLPHSTLKTEGYKIKNNGELHFLGKGREITANIEGSGSLTIDNPNHTLVLNGVKNGDDDSKNYSYSGQTYIKAGNLKLSQAKFATSPIVGAKDTGLSLEKSSLSTTVSGGHVTVSIDEKSVWHNKGDSNIGNLNIYENGALTLSNYPINIGPFATRSKPLANKLTISGNYHSNGGELTFYSKLAGDNSETDSMLVEGNTSGHTNVRVINLSGEGAQTDLGILLIEVQGLSNGDFKQVGRITAGAYEYKLGRGEAARNKNWYLTSNIEKSAPKEKDTAEVIPEKDDKIVKPYSSPHEVIKAASKSHYPANRIIDAFLTTLEMAFKPPVESEDTSVVKPTETPANALPTAIVATPTNAEPESTPVPNPTETPAKALPTAIVATPAKVKNSTKIPKKTYKPVYRPENGSYIANISMARNLFTSGLENRSGNYQYKDAVTGEWRVSSMWMHTQGGRKQFGNTIDQLNIKGKYHSIQLGGDLVQWDIGTQGSGRVGVLAGLGKATNYSQSKVTGYYSNGSVNGYNLGVYATWLTDQQDNTGFYIDTLAQYSWFNNTVNGQEQAEEKYKSSGFTSSVESGYAFNIGSTEQLSYFIQPSAQITWVGINAKTHTTANKDVITYNNRGQLITRIGAKTYLKTINNPNKQFMPFIAVNWLHQNQNTGTQLSGKSVENNNQSSAEFKIGIESKIDQKLHAWANVNHQIGHDNTSDTNALVGIKYSF
ncbi:outer membrane autotransporter [Yersinia aldovae]|nr:outer membrane autotransporter [Yersinia aldovae]